MKKLFFILVLLSLYSIPASARHVAGGELFYEFIHANNDGTSTYRVSLRLFRECKSNGPLLQNENPEIGIYDASTFSLTKTIRPPITDGVNTISLNTAAFACLVGNVDVCYEVCVYSMEVTLADTKYGYILSRVGCCRVDNITNLQPGSRNVGSNYVTKIPGTLAIPEGHNSSPQFFVRDTALVCANKKFKLDFGATDTDGDSLSYTFCDALSAPNGANTAPPPSVFNESPVPYLSPYNGETPLGPKVTINPATGLISGIAPATVGDRNAYVVSVCITEWRNVKPITQHRKDFILKVQDCDIAEADLPDKIVQCKDSVVHFENQSNSSAITSYLWEFGDKSGKTSTDPMVDYHYADTGRYIAYLTITGPNGCTGIDSTVVLVYPGFTPKFSILGSCYLNPYQFTDETYTKYGVVDSWRWDFADNTTTADTSRSQNPKYKYGGPNTGDIQMIVTNSKGCIDTAYKHLVVLNKPILEMPFKDTLICSIDSLPIPVHNTGQFSWTPLKNIINPNSSSPIVFPKDTTKYYVTLTDNGCTNTDSVTVNVLDYIEVELGPDSSICKTDYVQLHPESHGLVYQWTSSTGEPVNSVKYPVVRPLVTTTYYLNANLGKCKATDSIKLKPIPYPVAKAGPDTAVCLGSRIVLHGSMVASSLSWSPASSINNANTLTPTVGPSKTTSYILRVTDTLGCPKPVADTVVVMVIPPITANAGRDTIAVVGQPIQLNATGSEFFQWSPESYLNNPSIYNPVATIEAGPDSIRYIVRVSDRYGCSAEDDIVIRIIRSGPDIFVPNAFTPNADGKNDVIRPIPVGITSFQYFRIYNRWGEKVFATSVIGKGWDGLYNGTRQPSGAYVYETEGIDYKGNRIFRKGTIVLIR